MEHAISEERIAAAKRDLDNRAALQERIKKAKGTKQYIPEYCSYVVEVMGKGLGLMAFSKNVGASKAIIKKWAKEYPEFADALDEAEAARGAYWEQELINCSNTGKSAASAQWALKNIAPDDYRDKTEVVATNLNHNIDRDAAIKSVRDKFEKISANVVRLHEPK
jgi:hypothetical protein